MRNKVQVVAFLLWMLVGVPLAACSLNPVQEIPDSHIDANVPDEKDFPPFLVRDLEAYFKNIRKKPVQVKYELLRKGPTQTGVAYPKFYAWVMVFENDRLVDEGAVRLAAIEKKGFEITDYLSKDEIKRAPEKIGMTFPQLLIESIRRKAGISTLNQ